MDEQKALALVKAIFTLSKIPARLYRDGKLVAAHSSVIFIPDPVTPQLPKIEKQTDFVGVYATERLQFYGAIRYRENVLVLGPVGKIRLEDPDLVKVLFELNEDRSRTAELKNYFSAIPSKIEIIEFCEMLCAVNSCLNDVTLSPLEISIFNTVKDSSRSIYDDLHKNIETIQDNDYSDNAEYTTLLIEQSHDYEKSMIHFISHGEVEKLKELIGKTSAHAVAVGKLAHDNTRQLKNELICSAVLASRAAIDGGLDVELCYLLCNVYIQKIESAKTFSELASLSMQIVVDYASRVNEMLLGTSTSPIIERAVSYISRNINQRIFVEDIAKALNVNRSYLSVKFKAETGMTVTDYVMKQKIIEAQRLLRYTDKSLLQISSYLDFSSQSYFQLQFKKYTGMTPSQYKKSGS